MKRTMLIAIALLDVVAFATSDATAQHHRHSGVQVSLSFGSHGSHGCVHTYRPPVCYHPPVCVHKPVVVRPPIYTQPYVYSPYSASSIARMNAQVRHNLHDAHNDQERALRNMHRDQRDRLEQQIRLMPAGSTARRQLTEELIEMRRRQNEAEDRLDDRNDEQRRQVYRMQRR